VAHLYWLLLTNRYVDTCQCQPIIMDTWPNPLAPRVPIRLVVGCMYIKMTWGVRGVRPPDLPHQTLINSASQFPHMFLVMNIPGIIFKFGICAMLERGGGPGLSPDPWFHIT
jgi:hypothetical protein